MFEIEPQRKLLMKTPCRSPESKFMRMMRSQEKFMRIMRSPQPQKFMRIMRADGPQVTWICDNAEAAEGAPITNTVPLPMKSKKKEGVRQEVQGVH